MNLTPGGLAQAATSAILFTSIVMAVRDWGRMAPPQGNAVLRAAARWARAATVLVAIMVIMQLAAFGVHASAEFLNQGGWLMLVQAGAVLVLVPAGAAWAAQCGAKPLRLETRGWRAWPWPRLAAALAAMLLWTALTRMLFAPHENPDLARAFRIDEMPPAFQGGMLIAIITLAPILEEIIFRHYLLYRITSALGSGPGAGIGAILITSVLWAVGHGAAVDPYWFKWIQIAPMGIILSVVARKWGLEPAIALHWSFNLALATGFLIARS